MPKPLLVLVNGPAAGAGFSLAMLGDLVLSSRSAHYTAAYGAIGLTADGGLSWLLPRLVGLRMAQEIMLTNRRIKAEDAEAIGLVTRTVDEDALIDEGNAAATALANAPVAALGAARALLRESDESGLETQLDRELRSMAVAADLEAREGIAAYIVEALRTAGGRARRGGLVDVHPAELGATVLNALVARTGVDPAAVEDVIVGCVTQGGEQAFAFGRNLVLASSLPDSVPAVPIDRQRGSSQQALHFAAQAVMSGTQNIVIAAGAESMTRVPMNSNWQFHRRQAGVGTGPWSPAIQKRYGVAEFSQFHGAQAIADKYGLTREAMDEFAVASHVKAAAAIDSGAFRDEIVPVTTPNGVFDTDDGVRRGGAKEAISEVKTLEEGGTITAANASQMTDGASGAMIVSETALRRFNLLPLARIADRHRRRSRHHAGRADSRHA